MILQCREKSRNYQGKRAFFRYTPGIHIRLLDSPADLNAYDAWVRSHPQGTLWQSLAWKEYQEALGRETRLYACFNEDTLAASALVVIDRTSLGLSTWDIPRGPVQHSGPLLDAIIADARAAGAMVVYCSGLEDEHIPGSVPSPRHEQPAATRIIDISKDEEGILAQMHQKGRYNTKVAQKSGVTVRLSQEIESYYDLMKQTGERDRFGIKPLSHYKAFLNTIPGSFLLLAYGPHDPAKPVAGLIGVVHGTTGIYYYGASSYASRSLMAPYLLQWEAIRHCKGHGCARYDLLGVAPEGSGDDHPWAGISSFKEKFGGTLVSYPPEVQVVLRPFAMKALQMKRKILG